MYFDISFSAEIYLLNLFFILTTQSGFIFKISGIGYYFFNKNGSEKDPITCLIKVLRL